MMKRQPAVTDLSIPVVKQFDEYDQVRVSRALQDLLDIARPPVGDALQATLHEACTTPLVAGFRTLQIMAEAGLADQGFIWSLRSPIELASYHRGKKERKELANELLGIIVYGDQMHHRSFTNGLADACITVVQSNASPAEKATLSKLITHYLLSVPDPLVDLVANQCSWAIANNAKVMFARSLSEQERLFQSQAAPALPNSSYLVGYTELSLWLMQWELPSKKTSRFIERTRKPITHDGGSVSDGHAHRDR